MKINVIEYKLKIKSDKDGKEKKRKTTKLR